MFVKRSSSKFLFELMVGYEHDLVLYMHLNNTVTHNWWVQHDVSAQHSR